MASAAPVADASGVSVAVSTVRNGQHAHAVPQAN